MEGEYLEGFKLLVDAGATKCKPTIAVKFYQKCVCKAQREYLDAFIKLMKKNNELGWLMSFEEMMPSLSPNGLAVETCHYLKRSIPLTH